MTKDTPEMDAFANIVLCRFVSFSVGAGIGFGVLLWEVSFEHAVLIGLIIAKAIESFWMMNVCLDYLKEKRQQLSPISTESELK